jgi:hypothetical protein
VGLIPAGAVDAAAARARSGATLRRVRFVFQQESDMGTTLAEAVLAFLWYQWVCVILLIVVIVFYFVWKKKQ